MKRLGIIICLAIAGCIPEPRTILIDNEFTESEKSLIEDAIDEWIHATDSVDAMIFTSVANIDKPFTLEHWETNAEFGILFKVHESDPGYKDLVVDRGHSFVGLANDYTGNMLLLTDRFQNDRALYKIILHEFGHLHGLEHALDGVMEPGIKVHPVTGKLDNDAVCLSQNDLEQFCELNECGTNAHSTCEHNETP